MPPGRKWLRRLAALAALASAGTVGASAASPAGDGWTAQPDEQFLLDVRIRQFKLGDGVRAYNTPEGTCIVFGDFLTTLDVPMKINLTAKKAEGWAFKEQNRITVDLAARQASYGGKAEPIARGTVRETPDGWCVDSAALLTHQPSGVSRTVPGAIGSALPP